MVKKKNQPGLTITYFGLLFFSLHFFFPSLLFGLHQFITGPYWNPTLNEYNGRKKLQGAWELPQLGKTLRNATDTALQAAQSLQHSPSRGHAANPAPSKPPMQPHTLPGLKRPRWGSMPPTVVTCARGGGEGHKGRGGGEQQQKNNNNISQPTFKNRTNFSNSRTENQPDCLLYQY